MSMTTNKWQRYKAEAQSELSAVKAILDRASGQGRNLTDAEYKAAEEHKTKAMRLAGQAQQAKVDQGVVDAAKSLADDLGLGVGAVDYEDGGTGTSGVPYAKNRPAWGKALVAAHTDDFGRFKALTPAGQVIVSVPLNTEPVRDAEPVMALTQLIPARDAPGGRFSFLRQTRRDNFAAPVAEGAVKPTSAFELTRVDDRVRTIAHLSEPIPRQQIADAPLLQQFVDAELRLGLELALDAQILAGDGTAENLTGILNTSGISLQPWNTDVLATTRGAVTTIETLNLQPTGWVFSPADWERVEMAAGAAFPGASNQTAPVDAMSRRLWGVPVVVSTAMPAGTALLGDFAGSAALHLTEQARLDWSENVTDDFARNLIRFRCEGRFGLQVSRPSAFVQVALTATP